MTIKLPPNKPISGAWLRKWRERLELTQEGAAELLGFAHRNSIDKYERGERPIDRRLHLACLFIERQAQP